MIMNKADPDKQLTYFLVNFVRSGLVRCVEVSVTNYNFSQLSLWLIVEPSVPVFAYWEIFDVTLQMDVLSTFFTQGAAVEIPSQILSLYCQA